MQGLEDHDRIAEIVVIRDILYVSVPRPVDNVAVDHKHFMLRQRTIDVEQKQDGRQRPSNVQGRPLSTRPGGSRSGSGTSQGFFIVVTVDRTVVSKLDKGFSSTGIQLFAE